MPNRVDALTTLALALAASGLVVLASCSSTTTEALAPPAGDGAADAPAPQDDAGTDAARVQGCPGETPPTYPWQAPVAAVGSACSETDLSALATAIAKRTVVVAADITGALGPACAACAVGRVGDASWRAVVVGHEGYIGNVGGCAVRLGATEVCGAAIDRLSTCLIVGCAGCADRRAQDACSDQLTAVDAPCAAALVTMRKQCPAKTLAGAFDTNGACQSLVETTRLFCGPRDGG